MALFWRRLRHRLRGGAAAPLPRLTWALPLVMVFAVSWLYLSWPIVGPAIRDAPGHLAEPTPEPAAGATPSESPVRGQPIQNAGAVLSEIEEIYVDDLGSDPLRRRLQQALREEIRASTRFRAPKGRNDAGGVLKPVRLESGADSGKLTEGLGTAPVSLQLVNKEGEVLWKNSYTGTAVEIARQVLAELSAQ